VIGHTRVSANLGKVSDERPQRRSIRQKNREMVQPEQSTSRHSAGTFQLLELDENTIFAVRAKSC
jgi:hypothetical protein